MNGEEEEEFEEMKELCWLMTSYYGNLFAVISVDIYFISIKAQHIQGNKKKSKKMKIFRTQRVRNLGEEKNEETEFIDFMKALSISI